MAGPIMSYTAADTFTNSVASHFAMTEFSPDLSTSAGGTTGAEAVPAPLTFDLITERAAFDALEADWNALFARAGRSTQVFLTFNWNWHWANHYLASAPGGIAGLNLAVVTARRAGRLVMVWPLVSERVRGITQIFWMGEPVSQYGDVLIDDMDDQLEAMRAGWQFLKSHAKGDIVRLRRVRADATVAPLIAEIGALASNQQTAPFLDLASAKSFTDYEQRYSAKARRNRRRHLRRLEEQSEVTFTRQRGGAVARELAVEALKHKAAWLADRGLVSHAISDQRMSRFFADAAEAASHPVDCVVSSLKANGETAALDVSFACKGRLVVHVIVFNLKHEKAGVGSLLLEQCIRDAFSEGMTTLDMMAPGDNYKLDWADASVEVTDWSRPLTIAGHTYARIYLGLVRGKVKKAMAAMPQSLRRLVSGNTGRAA
jgi:CelD/BcsL family acetyltransferase involved in cellulose biosynthesis